LQPRHTNDRLHSMTHFAKKIPSLTVVGAGPGDPELLTLKGLKALQSADVVLYDALANEALLAHAPLALKIFVGKKRGQKPFDQDAINALIIEKAAQHGHVVRLKGGDPLVFGRGMEEMVYAAERGLATAYVPGISSAIGVPGLAGIPVTHREMSRGFWVITATTSDGSLPPDVAMAARTDATVVILMGLAKLAQIMAVFQAADRGHLPVAVLQNGSLPNANTVVATVDTILLREADIQPQAPTIIVLGEVAALAGLYSSSKTASKSTEISSMVSVSVPTENIV
jgi:uroporphyrin-III C-methyltransferase